MPRQTRSASSLLAHAAHDVARHRLSRIFGEIDLGSVRHEGEGEGSGGGEPEKKKPAEDLIPREEAKQAFKDRDKAKAGIRIFAESLGIDHSDVQIVPTGEKDNPWKLEAPGLDEARQLLADARRKKDDQKKTGKWEDRETELTQQHEKKLNKQRTSYERQVIARDKLLSKLAVTTPIRVACKEEGAIDDDGTGTFDDILALLSPRVRVEVQQDEDSDDAKLKVTVLDEEGQPATDKKGEPLTVRQLVADFLNKKKKFKKANFVAGPGAGQNGTGSNGRGFIGGGDGATQTADELFGLAKAAR